MERQMVTLAELPFLFINGPLVFFNLAANIFYARCLIFPKDGQKLKQPLKILLDCLVGCSVIYFVSFATTFGALMVQEIVVFWVSWMILLFYVYLSVSSSVWLNFYYYIQIVPSQRAHLIWVKRNIRLVIYTVLLSDTVFFLFCDATNALKEIYRELTVINGTWTEVHPDELYSVSEVNFYVVKLHTLGCLFIMTFSSFSTARYLHRHVKSVSKGGSISSRRIRRQVRVTISGIFQGLLYFLYGTYYFFDSFTYKFSNHFIISGEISFTVTSLYISGTTINLGIGQTTFRQRAADVWKALKAVCGANGVKTRTRLSTSGEISETVTVTRIHCE